MLDPLFLPLVLEVFSQYSSLSFEIQGYNVGCLPSFPIPDLRFSPFRFPESVASQPFDFQLPKYCCCCPLFVFSHPYGLIFFFFFEESLYCRFRYWMKGQHYMCAFKSVILIGEVVANCSNRKAI